MYVDKFRADFLKNLTALQTFIQKVEKQNYKTESKGHNIILNIIPIFRKGTLNTRQIFLLFKEFLDNIEETELYINEIKNRFNNKNSSEKITIMNETYKDKANSIINLIILMEEYIDSMKKDLSKHLKVTFNEPTKKLDKNNLKELKPSIEDHNISYTKNFEENFNKIIKIYEEFMNPNTSMSKLNSLLYPEITLTLTKKSSWKHIVIDEGNKEPLIIEKISPNISQKQIDLNKIKCTVNYFPTVRLEFGKKEFPMNCQKHCYKTYEGHASRTLHKSGEDLEKDTKKELIKKSEDIINRCLNEETIIDIKFIYLNTNPDINNQYGHNKIRIDNYIMEPCNDNEQACGLPLKIKFYIKHMNPIIDEYQEAKAN